MQDGRRKAVYRSTPDIAGLISTPGSTKELTIKSDIVENKPTVEKNDTQVNQLNFTSSIYIHEKYSKL